VKTAPGQPELLDVTDDEAERLNAQAVKYSAPELARVISLLLAAQTDMRWTTSPRLSLELALIRSTIPEADERPEALVSRLERLERLSGLTSGSAVVPPSSGSAPPEPSAAAPEPAPTKRPTTPASAKRPDEPKPTPAKRPEEPKVEPAAEEPVAVVLGAGTSAVDVSMLRSNWSTVIQHLRSQGKAVLPSFLEVATPAAFDGQTLELVFPPDRRFGVSKVEEREAELRQALQELLGIAPAIRCVVREPVAGVIDVEDDPPLSEEEALARLTAELGATPATEDGG
jgi:DNA polymerase-3 subunit gamma/tau